MKRFAALFAELDGTTGTKAKVAALAEYFSDAPEPDRLWTIALLSGRRPKRSVTTRKLREWAAERADLPGWLFDESYTVVGDLAETIALVLPSPEHRTNRSLSEWINWLSALAPMEEDAKKLAILEAWNGLPTDQRMVFNKLITGGFRMGVSQTLMTRALAQATGMDEASLAHRLMGDWTPGTTTFNALINSENTAAEQSRPYPFYLAYQLDTVPSDLGAPEDWIAEWKWDGIRGQLIRRGGEHHLWSRGEDLMTPRFPELAATVDFLPDGTVLDGEILGWDFATESPMPFNALQKRIGRKTVPAKLLRETPVVLRAYDLLEWDAQDLRNLAFSKRRDRLEALIRSVPATAGLRLSPRIAFDDWDTLATLRDTARDRGAEGLMLKRASSTYRTGRKKGDWWKWKVDPLVIDAVMIYAQAGHGRRANLFTDFTFAVRRGDEMVPFTKAYTGLTDAEFNQITAWVRKNTLERFGPVRRVPPELVFEIAFEGIQKSARHKSGVALRFPRMARWRKDKPASEANTFDDLQDMLRHYG